MNEKPPLILLVEDSDELLWVVANILDAAGFHVEAALSGGEALEEWGRHPETALVILNYRLPDMSGLSVLRRLRERGYTRPVIAISGFGTREVKEGFLSKGAFAFLEKPFDMHVLIGQCRMALNGQPGVKTEAVNQA
ncbi:signal transduction response regulator receiver domain [Desulfoluna butyratoxydans]|uniref:Signal transduction response regulator receiver domain n=1 Tax=Desulfoluna butyratoxydans TaxID=231438 RepID=A0A4U8YHL6_9BACT|nr:signal transduction response regulator receiver domain [Desulfoluna butyratoxydans]